MTHGVRHQGAQHLCMRPPGATGKWDTEGAVGEGQAWVGGQGAPWRKEASCESLAC